MTFFGWSWRLGTLRGIEYRISWILLVFILFGMVSCVHVHRIDLVPLAMITPILAVALHFWGHLLALRLVRGRTSATLFTVWGDLTEYDSLALRIWPQFIVPAAGILTSAVLWLGGSFICIYFGNSNDAELMFSNMSSGFPKPMYAISSWPLSFMSMLSMESMGLMIINLLPIMTLDGARMWRAVLWPILGLQRAVRWTIIAGLTISSLITIFAVASLQIFLFIMGACLLMLSIAEYRSMHISGFDLVLQCEPRVHDRHKGGLWGRIRVMMDERRQKQDEVSISREQVVLDELLAKVAAGGLPALSAKERATLAKISVQQKRRQGG